MARMQERHGGDGRSWLADDAARRRKISGRGNTSEAPGGALATDGVAWRSGMDAWRACKAEGVEVRPRGHGVVGAGMGTGCVEKKACAVGPGGQWNKAKQ